MTGLLLTARLAAQCADAIRTLAQDTGVAITPVLFPEDDAALSDTALAGVEMAYASPDIFEGGRSAWPFLDALDRAPALRWTHLGWAGVDHPRVARLLDRGVRLSNSPGAAAEPIAHSAMAGLLALARRFPRFIRQQQQHDWQRLPAGLVPPDLSTQTLVIFGLGAIGGEIARLARPFGLRVIGVRRSPRTPADSVDALVPPDQLDTILPRADWLVVAAPLTQETRGAISAARLALLPPGAHVINVARGKIIDETALIAAIQSGAVGGAYLDVFSEEPLPAESPLWDLPSVILTPHNSWAAQGNAERARQIFLVNLECWVRGAPLPQEIRER